MKNVVMKSAILICLIVLCIYQISNLWFSQIAGKSFVSILDAGREKEIYIEDRLHLLTMREIGVYDSEGNVTAVKRLPEEYKELYEKSFQLVVNVITKGALETGAMNLDMLKGKERIHFNLVVPLPAKVFAGDLGISEKLLRDIEIIDGIGIIPSCEQAAAMIYLVDSEHKMTNYYSGYTRDIENICKSLKQVMVDVNGRDYPRYESSLLKDDNRFIKEKLLPFPQNNLIYDEDIYFKNPYMTEEGFNKSELENYVNQYFENPALKWIAENGNIIEYGDKKIRVQYTTDGLFEYETAYSKDISVRPINYTEAFNVAETFLEADKTLLEVERILEDYIVEDNHITFFYSYSYSDFPIRLEDDFLKSYNMRYPMEITVVDNEVTNYKRILVQREDFMPQKSQLSTPYEDVLKKFEETHSFDTHYVDDMYLGYYWKADNHLIMQWFIEKDNVYYRDNVW